MPDPDAQIETVTLPTELLLSAVNVLASLPYNHGVPGQPEKCSGDVVHALRAAMTDPPAPA